MRSNRVISLLLLTTLFSLIPSAYGVPPIVVRGNGTSIKKNSVDVESMAKPADVSLKGNQRSEYITTPLGRIHLRWPRSVELLFGRTPEKAMADAAQAISRALKRPGFPPELQSVSMEWDVVFMDETLPESQIPQTLVSNCHPAWMTPPANLYVVGQRVVAGCTGSRLEKSPNADPTLAHILIHEMGHALEYRLLAGRGGNEARRAEGFATWFEAYASDYSSVLTTGAVKNSFFKAAKDSIKKRGFPPFAGTFEDYATASMIFWAIESKRGVGGIMEVYKIMRERNMDLQSALSQSLGWDESKTEDEVRRILK